MGQVGRELAKRGFNLVDLLNLVTMRSGLSPAGDETVRWENCLRTHGTSSTPDTSL